MPVSTRSRIFTHLSAKPTSTYPTTPPIPSESEREYKELIHQREDLHRRICQKNNALVQFERSILSFYYAHAICSEKELSAILSSLDSAPKRPSHGFSEVSRRMCELREQEERQEKERAEYKAAIASMEETYEQTIIHGKLATQEEAVNRSQSELCELNVEFEKQRQMDQDLTSLIENLERELQDLRKEKDKSALRKAVLEEKKRHQMENLGNTRRELQKAHADALQAQKELERRETINQDLKNQIEEHSMRLKRRKLN
ncbi:unnamed protein product [Phytomonas sp. Hart1]|nr:unnamed protein product [Phytomonas sp. Hart1]|eukprot:CCW66595.1 unnamed protein product [Phytomonas sp. isolate Hart1]